MTTNTPTAATVLDARLREPWTVTDELARLVALEHSNDPRTRRCAACGYLTSKQLPNCRSHIVARALYEHSSVKDLPPVETRPVGAATPAGQLALFPAPPNTNGRTRP
jgi:hypothetical protein